MYYISCHNNNKKNVILSRFLDNDCFYQLPQVGISERAKAKFRQTRDTKHSWYLEGNTKTEWENMQLKRGKNEEGMIVDYPSLYANVKSGTHLQMHSKILEEF